MSDVNWRGAKPNRFVTLYVDWWSNLSYGLTLFENGKIKEDDLFWRVPKDIQKQAYTILRKFYKTGRW